MEKEMKKKMMLELEGITGEDNDQQEQITVVS